MRMFIQQHNFGNDLTLRIGRTDGVHNSGDHLHQSFEFEIVTEGEIEITVDGEKQVARAGDIAVIPSFRIHSFYTPKQVKMMICVFPNAFLIDFLSLAELGKKRATNVFHASDGLWNYLIKGGFYENVRTKHKFDPEQDANYIHSLKATFYLILSEYFSTVPVTGSSHIDNTLSKILIYISENYCSDISLENVGTALGYSPKYVSNCLKAIPNLNFRSLINSLRVERAKTLLVTTDKYSLEIAEACGFVSQASFHRVFRELVGTTPQQYRAERKNKA